MSLIVRAKVIRNTDVNQIKMLQNATCQTVCNNKIPAEDGKFINDRIREDYALNWLVDGLPAAEMKKDLKSDQVFYDMGFELGSDNDDDDQRSSLSPALHNHYEIVMRFADDC
jgi:transmembrane 9 superfamily member 2/4